MCMKTVYKYPLKLQDYQVLSLPQGAVILHVDYQGMEDLFLWALVDTNAPLEPRGIRIAGTGHDLNISGWYKYINTVFSDWGLVWHIFEVMVNGKAEE